MQAFFVIDFKICTHLTTSPLEQGYLGREVESVILYSLAKLRIIRLANVTLSDMTSLRIPCLENMDMRAD